MKKSQYNILAGYIIISRDSMERLIMLVGFSIQNFKSFKEMQSISFVASKVTRHKRHVWNVNDRRILKSGLIFGANAGGKSNLVEAIDLSRKIIIDGLDKVDLNKKHFRISKEAYREPGVFDYRIIVNKTEYSYGIVVSYDKKEIIAEWLVRIEKSGKEVYLFNRQVDDNGISNIDTEVTGQSVKDETRFNIYLQDFAEGVSEILKKKTILSDIAMRSNPGQSIFGEISDVFSWFKRMIVIFPNTKYSLLNQLTADSNMQKFFTSVLSYFDTGIEAVNNESAEIDMDKILDRMNEQKKEELKIHLSNVTEKNPILFKVDKQIYSLYKDESGNIFSSKMLLNHGNSDDLFEYSDESDGTQRLFDFVPLFLEKYRNSIIIIDEIDRSLHTNLIHRFMQKFYYYTEESACQLLATTHDSNLLDLELLRQDEIWFVERQEDHSSSIFSLNKFRERFDKRIDKEYLLGRYGAIPVFDDDFGRWEDVNE